MKQETLDYLKSIITEEVILAAIVAIEHIMVAKNHSR